MLVVLATVEAAVLVIAVWAMLMPDAAEAGPQSMHGLVTAAMLSLCCITSLYYTDLYDRHVATDVRAFPWRLVRAGGLAFVLLSALYMFVPPTPFRTGVVMSTVIIAGLLAVTRLIGCGVIRSRWFRRRVMIVGEGPLAEALLAEIKAQAHLRYEVFVLGGTEHLGVFIEQVRPARIIVVPGQRRGKLAVQLLLEARARGVVVEDGLDAYERLTGKLAIESLLPSALLFSPGFRRARVHRALARVVSLVAAAAGLVLFGPLMAVIALAVALDSPGGVFFVQERVGLHNRPFRLYKFRTMRPDPSDTSLWVRDNGHRITRVGRWIRKFRLDELPQVLNILRGDMNLVGPRPHPVRNYALFTERIPYYSLRTVMRPGVTGWAQVRYGYANDLQEETEKMRYDLYYVKHLSIWFDLLVLFDTVKVVLFGLGTAAAPVRRVSPVAREARGARDAA
jgi:exopolysaccharide biosynthesis polyprenyl glycosylphosphotransferase